MPKIKIMQDRGIYGKVERDAYTVDGAEAVAIFKGDKIWSLFHIASGLSVDSLIPATFKRTKSSLTDFVKRMEAENKDAFWELAAVDSASGWKQSQKEAAATLVTWGRSQL